MTTKEKLEKRRDELAHSHGNDDIKVSNKSRCYRTINYKAGFNTLAPSWLKLYEALNFIRADADLEKIGVTADEILYMTTADNALLEADILLGEK